MRQVVSIDPGKKGAIAVFEDGKFKYYKKMPLIGTEVDFKELYKILHPCNYDDDVYYVLEYTKVNYSGGKSQIASSSMQLGCILGYLSIFEKPWYVVPPNKWQKYVCKGIDKTGNTKLTSYMAFQRLFPDLIDMVKINAQPKFDDGIVDAILLGHYAIKEVI